MDKYILVLNRELIFEVDDFLAVLMRSDKGFCTDFPKLGEFDERDPKYHFSLDEIYKISPYYVPLAKFVG